MNLYVAYRLAQWRMREIDLWSRIVWRYSGSERQDGARRLRMIFAACVRIR